MTRNMKIGVGAIALLGACGVCSLLSTISTDNGGGTDSVSSVSVMSESEASLSDPPSSSSSISDSPSSEDSPSEQIAQVGDTVQAGDSAWIVDAVTNHGNLMASGNEFVSDVTSSGKLIQVDVRVMSTGDDSFSLTAPKVTDSEGREFDASSDVFMVIDTEKSCIFETINPGIQKACTWVFDVPADASGLMLQASGGMFTDSVPILLGE